MFLSSANANIHSYAELFWYLTGETAPSNPRGLIPAPLKALYAPVESSPLHALIIGINNYKSVDKLDGAVSDAKEFLKYLEECLKVPSRQIRLLLDEQASRTAIIEAFHQLQNDSRIKMDDPIIIFYAGHGTQLTPPAAWEAGGAGRKIQALVPQNCTIEDGIYPIPDRTISALINGIAKKKGDNITVIFDCCHSSSGTRDTYNSSHHIRSVELPDNLPPHLDDSIWDDGSTRGSSVAPGFTKTGLQSHVLLAACSEHEQAIEQDGHGQFTTALLRLLRNEGAEKLTYSDVLRQLENIPGQNPQCEGYNRDRNLFRTKAFASMQPVYRVAFESGKYTVGAGAAHGISAGAQFAIYENDNAVTRSTPLANLDVHSIDLFSSTLRPPTDTSLFKLGPSSVALQSRAGTGGLSLHVPLDEKNMPIFKAIHNYMQETDPEDKRICLVQKDRAMLEAVVKNGKINFHILDAQAVSYGLRRMHFTIEPTVDAISPILRGAAHYYWHLYRLQANEYIEKGIKIEFTALEKSKTNFDEHGRPILHPVQPNLYHNGVVQITIGRKTIYGIKITNKTNFDLFPAVFFFNSSDMSIVRYYEMSTSGKFKLDVPLQKNGGTLTIGYGSGGAPPFSYTLRDGENLDVGFLKLFLMTEPVELSRVPQASPFEEARPAVRFQQGKLAKAWGTLLIPVIQRRE
ncbi:hypothetical protein CPB86DRAFT_813539 [Serendipita vermifera]|nr:hypothetical protein CPB86DRAFT_813539 [Serendipita vermifera]